MGIAALGCDEHKPRLASSLQSDQILLGVVAVKYRAAPDIKDLVKDLDDAGKASMLNTLTGRDLIPVAAAAPP